MMSFLWRPALFIPSPRPTSCQLTAEHSSPHPAEITTDSSGSPPVHPEWSAVRSSEGSFPRASLRKRSSIFFTALPLPPSSSSSGEWWCVIHAIIFPSFLDLHPGQPDSPPCRIHLSPNCDKVKPLCLFVCLFMGGLFIHRLGSHLEWTLVCRNNKEKKKKMWETQRIFYYHLLFI